MKILYYSPHPQLQRTAPTGYGTHIREMIAAWLHQGHDVKTFIAGDHTSEGLGQGRPSVLRSGMRAMTPSIVWESLKDLRLIKEDTRLERTLGDIAEDFQPDLIYERVAYMQNSGIRVAQRLNIRHIAEINAPYPEERTAFSGKSWMLGTARDNLREVLVKSDCISVVSSALKSHFTEVVPEAAPKIHVVANCVNPAAVSHDTTEVERLRNQLGLNQHTIVGFVGSIFPYHGVDLLVEAFTELRLPKTKLLIVGDGYMLPELRTLVKSRNALDRVVFAGSVPHRQVYPLIELMDVCCMAKSNWYGSPVKIFEYGLMKRPIIAPDVAPIRDVMDDEDALIVPPSTAALRRALQTMLTQEDKRAQLAANWHRKVLLRHTWDTAAKTILSQCT